MVQLKGVSVRKTLMTFDSTCVTVADDFPVGLNAQASAPIILKDKVDNAYILLDYQQVAEGVESD